MTGPFEFRHSFERRDGRACLLSQCLTATALAVLCALTSAQCLAAEKRIADSGWLTTSPTLGPVIEPPKPFQPDPGVHLLANESFLMSKPAAKNAKPSAQEPVYTARRRDAKPTFRKPRLVDPSGDESSKRSSKHLLTTPVREDLDYNEATKSHHPTEMPEESSPEADAPKAIVDLLAPAPPPTESLDTEATPAPHVAPKKVVSNHADVVPLPGGSDSASTAPESSTKPLQPLTRSQIQLRNKVRRALSGYYKRALNSQDHDPWEAMHGLLAFGANSRILQGGQTGKPMTMVGWLCYGKPCKGQTMMYVNPDGELRVKVGVGLQGHDGQFLAMLAQSRIAPNYPIRVKNHQFTVADLIEAEKKTCYPKSELTFKLIALGYYLDSDESWVNDQGSTWDIPRLIREELAQPIRGAACGGTHRLAGLSLAVKTRIARGEPVDGDYALADQYVKKYHQYAFRLQNRDGSLSTSWFKGPGSEDDIDRRIKTTGHILEWLVYSLDDEELVDPRTVRSVNYLANLMLSNYDHAWEVGPVCHATHALLLYDQRVFQPHDGPERVASKVYRINGPVNRHNPSKSFWDWGR